jgi:hypothetical protein
MIVSASYKTDIPAFFGRWFMNRLKDGHCRMVNPWGGQVYLVPLDRRSVSGFVFWTKNLGPFLAPLEDIRDAGYPFTVQYSINGYPRALETNVTNTERSIGHMHRLRARYGPRCAVWRYDPLLITSITPPEWHIGNFRRLAARIQGATDEVTISFTHMYRKTGRNLRAAADAGGFTWHDPEPAEKRALALKLTGIAGEAGMALTVCAQPEFTPAGATAAHCIDGARLSDVAGRPIAAPIKGNRPGCLCHLSRDIGAYDSCPHGCVYCYAVSDAARAKARLRDHDADGEFLLPPAPSARPSAGA